MHEYHKETSVRLFPIRGPYRPTMRTVGRTQRVKNRALGTQYEDRRGVCTSASKEELTGKPRNIACETGLGLIAERYRNKDEVSTEMDAR